MPRRIIGVHSGHDASASLLVDNVVVCSIAKERLTRVKHDHGDPVECVDYILKHYRLTPKDIDLVIRSNWYDAQNLNNSYYKRFKRVIESRQHHLFHAYAASIVSESGDSLVMVNDGRGCRPIDNNDRNGSPDSFEIESVYQLKNGRLHSLEKEYRHYTKNKFPWGSHIDSLGYAYGAVSKKIFGSTHSAGKVMALASFNDNSHSVPDAFIFGHGTKFTVNPEWTDYLESCPNKIDWNTSVAKSLAYNIQRSLEQYFEFRIEELATKYHCSEFTFSGGIALNCKNNGLLANSPAIKRINLFPACGDDGLSVGATVWAVREVYNNFLPIRYQISQGVSYGRNILDIIPLAKQIAQLLTSDKVVGIHHKGSEFGPRALGNRSILSAAHDIKFKERLNSVIKERESFRPFGGMVLEKNLSYLTSDKLANPYMLSAAQVKPGIKIKYPSLVHVDGTVRIQVIKEDCELIHHILTEYQKLTGLIAIINTSFNGCDEPIVETEVQAYSAAKKMGLDYLCVSAVLEEIT